MSKPSSLVRITHDRVVRVLKVFLLTLDIPRFPGVAWKRIDVGVDQFGPNITAWTLVQHADFRWYHGRAQGPPFSVDNLQDKEGHVRELGGLSRPTCLLVISRYIEAVARDVS